MTRSFLLLCLRVEPYFSSFSDFSRISPLSLFLAPLTSGHVTQLTSTIFTPESA